MATKCKRCGKPLKDPASIARGMGPQCAGATNGETRTREPRLRRGTGQFYALVTGDGDQLQLFALGAERAEKETPAEKRTRIQAAKAQRRACFERRQPFQCGINARTGKPVIYSPTEDGDWLNSDGCRIAQSTLEKYLVQYSWL